MYFRISLLVGVVGGRFLVQQRVVQRVDRSCSITSYSSFCWVLTVDERGKKEEGQHNNDVRCGRDRRVQHGVL